ncbi:BglG family transcription antiterminator [Cytobacillus gottheilii]|uniref:BglG family transcription antiterminator n=1 Tax=Cytobacillus gottheilii TaxID=859144 RepID=UPI0009BA8EB3|nr:BglG family transcription antiterminator [Cytobacillus gottheilii]
MSLDERSMLILQEVAVLPSVQSEYLSSKYGLSKDQINYSFKKINDWLEVNNLPIITKDANGHYKSKALIKKLLTKEQKEKKANFILTPIERAQLLCYILLCKTEYLTLFHLTKELQVSKNTVLADLNQARIIASSFSVNIGYSRLEGYYVEGKEWNKRLFLIALIETFIKNLKGSLFIEIYGGLDKEEITRMANVISICERNLQILFTDEKHDSLPYIFASILKRVEIGLTLEKKSIDLTNKGGYRILSELINIRSETYREELSFLTLQLLTASLSDSLEEKVMVEHIVIRGIHDMLDSFEQTTCLFLSEREELIEKLILHLRPAFYRIKYGVVTDTDMSFDENAFNLMFDLELKELHHLVKKSISPLELAIGKPIPEKEIKYLTMLLGGWMELKGDSLQQRIKALVVCPNGMSVSKLMKSTLSQLFPEFVFMDALSVREFKEYRLDFDVVFSPIYLDTDKKLYVIKPFMENKEKEFLRRQVMQAIYGFNTPVFNSEELMKIISKYADIKNENALKREINNLIKQSCVVDSHISNDDEKPDLAALIPIENIIIKQKVKSWRHAIQMASQPLLDQQYITEDYVTKMVELHDVEQPYIVYGSDIVLPHATPEDGVKKLGMSLLIITDGVKVSSTQTVKLVVVLAPINKNLHLRALIQLSKLSESPEIIDNIISSSTPKDVHLWLEDFSMRMSV